MARTTWIVSTQTGSGGSWEESSFIYCPNENLEMDKTGGLQTVKLCNGANGFIQPEVIYTDEPITFSFLHISESDGFRDILEGFVTSGTYLRIQDHLGNYMYGVFSSVKRVWLTDVADDYYDLQAVFVRM